jgi:hypothetical protein
MFLLHLVATERSVAAAKAAEDAAVATAAGKPVQSPKSLPSVLKVAFKSTSRKCRCSISHLSRMTN